MIENQFFPQLATEHLGVLRRRNIDGVVPFGFTGITEEMLVHWQSSLVLLTRSAEGFVSVCYDDEGAVKILMQWLYDQGHCNISYLGVSHSDVTTGKRRHEAYLTFCKAHRLYPVAALPRLAIKQGYGDVAEAIMPETTALLYATNTLALDTSKYLQERRIDTLQLTGVGNTPLMKFLRPGIVTAGPDYARAGCQAACQLIAQVTGRNELQQIIIPATLSRSSPER